MMNEAKKLKSLEVQGQVASNGTSSRADQPDASRPFFKEDNPMKIDLILEVLFDFCPSSTLGNCRLVCKQWRDVSLKAWRNKATLCLSENGMRKLPAALLQRYDVRRLLDLDPDNDLQLEKYPFRKFRVDESILKYLKNDRKPITYIARHVILSFEDFWQGEEFLSRLHSLESLELRNCEWWRNVARASEPFILEKMKRLKLAHSGQNERYDLSRGAILLHFPNLEALSLESRTILPCLDNTKRILGSAESIRENNEFRVDVLPVKQLEIINVPPVAHGRGSCQKFDKNLIQAIVQCGFLLEKLALDLAFSGEKMNIEKAMRSMNRLLNLNSSSESIQYLRTCFYFDIDMFIDRVIGRCKGEKERKRKFWRILKPIPDLNILMEVLKELKVANGLWGLYLLSHLNLPNLEKLTVEYGNFEKKVNILNYQIRLIDFQEKVFPKLESFELTNNQETLGPESITLIAKMMPTLSALTCPLDKQSFQIVCERFRGLKTLNIQGARCSHALLDDVTLTGISVSKKWAPRPPNITDLASLTDLSISGDAGAFKENSVMYGFLQLPRLYFLSVAFEKISDETKAKLMRHVKGSVQILDEERLDLNVSESDDDILTGESSSSDESEIVEDNELSETEDSD